MKKRLTIPEVMTARQVANLLHRITRLKWTKSVLFRQDSWDKRYCALGQIAKCAGVKDEILRSTGVSDHVEYRACEPVYSANDISDTKEQAIQRLCEQGERPIPVGRFITKLLARQKARGL